MATWTTVASPGVWGFDIENRPGTYMGGDFTSNHMLSLAGQVEGRPRTMRYLDPDFTAEDLEVFVEPIRAGALVTGHNIIRHDLPILNGTLVKLGAPPLGPVRVSDTYAHLLKRGRAFSASLANLCRRFDLPRKGSMSESDWEEVYAGEPGAWERLRAYNVADVRVQLALRKKLLALGLLRPPSVWRP